ncbi:MAG: O-antigen ligase family protein [Betaproteobacteria bacterium]
MALSAYLIVLATQYKLAVSPRSLLLFLLFVAWVSFTDSRSGEFLPALAMDSHWFVLPIATLLFAGVFREFPIAFQSVRVGAALCIINLLLTMFMESEWYFHWHYPPIFGHIRHLGLSVGFMTILLYSKNETKGWTAVFFRLCRILSLTLVFWSGTRASILSLACCMAVFIYTDRCWAKILLLESIIAIALSLFTDPAYPGASGSWPRIVGSGAINSIGDITANSLSASRLEIWGATLSGLNNIGNLWTGIGGNGFARLQTMHGVVIMSPGHVHGHNVIIQSICDWGIVGVVLLSGFFYQSIIRSIITDLKHNEPTALAGITYLLVTGMLDATLFHLEHLIYLAIAMAWLISQKPQSDVKPNVIPVALAIALLLGLALLHTQTFDYRIGLGWYFRTQ